MLLPFRNIGNNGSISPHSTRSTLRSKEVARVVQGPCLGSHSPTPKYQKKLLASSLNRFSFTAETLCCTACIFSRIWPKIMKAVYNISDEFNALCIVSVSVNKFLFPVTSRCPPTVERALPPLDIRPQIPGKSMSYLPCI
jgi:hypothetical protein